MNIKHGVKKREVIVFVSHCQFQIPSLFLFLSSKGGQKRRLLTFSLVYVHPPPTYSLCASASLTDRLKKYQMTYLFVDLLLHLLLFL